MKIKDQLPTFVGQQAIRNRVNFYLESHRTSNIYPTSLMVAHRGGGKTLLCNLIAEKLGKQWVVCTASSIRSVKQFIEEIVIPYIVDKDITFILDELHACPIGVQTTLLTILEPNKEHFTTYQHDGGTISFDFRRFTFLGATTNPEQCLPPLLDRFGMHRFDFADYTDKDLAKVLALNSEIFYDEEIIPEIVSISRRNCRRIVDLTNDLKRVAEMSQTDLVTKDMWFDFRDRMGIKKWGLTDIEIEYLQLLQERRKMTLTALSASLQLAASTVRTDIELYLLKRNLISIEPKGRILTQQGTQILKEV